MEGLALNHITVQSLGASTLGAIVGLPPLPSDPAELPPRRELPDAPLPPPPVVPLPDDATLLAAAAPGEGEGEGGQGQLAALILQLHRALAPPPALRSSTVDAAAAAAAAAVFVARAEAGLAQRLASLTLQLLQQSGSRKAWKRGGAGAEQRRGALGAAAASFAVLGCECPWSSPQLRVVAGDALEGISNTLPDGGGAAAVFGELLDELWAALASSELVGTRVGVEVLELELLLLLMLLLVLTLSCRAGPSCAAPSSSRGSRRSFCGCCRRCWRLCRATSRRTRARGCGRCGTWRCGCARRSWPGRAGRSWRR